MSQRLQAGAAVGCLLIALPLLVVLSPIISAALAWEEWRAGALRRRFAREHGAATRGLLVYSNSPNWQLHIENQWLPQVRDRLVVLNWSERARWNTEHPLEAALFRRHLGGKEFNPAAIVFRPHKPGQLFRLWIKAIRDLDPLGMLAPYRQSVDVVRFWRPFRDYKHGREQALGAAEAELWGLLELPGGPHIGV